MEYIIIFSNGERRECQDFKLLGEGEMARVEYQGILTGYWCRIGLKDCNWVAMAPKPEWLALYSKASPQDVNWLMYRKGVDY